MRKRMSYSIAQVILIRCMLLKVYLYPPPPPKKNKKK